MRKKCPVKLKSYVTNKTTKTKGRATIPIQEHHKLSHWTVWMGIVSECLNLAQCKQTYKQQHQCVVEQSTKVSSVFTSSSPLAKVEQSKHNSH